MTTSYPGNHYPRSKMHGLIEIIRRQNRAYDELRYTSPNTRFILFIAPMLLSIVGDMILVILWGLPSFLFIVTMSIMAAWRLLGTLIVLNRRT